MDGEIRQNRVTKEWVIFAPVRGKRPHDYRQAGRDRSLVPTFDPQCPLCPGNEHMLPGVLDESPGEGHGSWQNRVVPNKYPILTPEGSTERRREGIYLSMQGYGLHEVIIESPRHDDDLATMPRAGVEALLETYQRRFEHWRQDERNVVILIFRNHGPRAGASLDHPASQLVTTGMVPRYIRWREYEAKRYYDEWGRCVYCDILASEVQDRRRVVLENSSFVVFVPYAANVPFETWIVPKRHHSDFGQITPEERSDLAHALHSLLGRLARKLQNPDYNYIINSASRSGNEPQNHWYIRVRPRLVTRAGFEIGTGIRINPSVPEDDAAYLREDAGDEAGHGDTTPTTAASP